MHANLKVGDEFYMDHPTRPITSLTDEEIISKLLLRLSIVRQHDFGGLLVMSDNAIYDGSPVYKTNEDALVRLIVEIIARLPSFTRIKLAYDLLGEALRYEDII